MVSELIRGYSLALLEISKEEKKVKTFYNQIKIVFQTLEENPKIIDVLDSLSIDQKDKDKIIDKAYKGLEPNLINTFKLLSSKNQFKHCESILKKLKDYLQDELKIKEGIVYSVSKLNPSLIKKLETKVSNQLNSKITLTNHIDRSLIGGFKVVIDDIIIEDSIKSYLETMKQNLIDR